MTPKLRFISPHTMLCIVGKWIDAFPFVFWHGHRDSSELHLRSLLQRSWDIKPQLFIHLNNQFLCSCCLSCFTSILLHSCYWWLVLKYSTLQEVLVSASATLRYTFYFLSPQFPSSASQVTAFHMNLCLRVCFRERVNKTSTFTFL